MESLIGKRLDGLYEVQELIGRGGMSNVYRAVSVGEESPVPSGTTVAVKVLREEFSHDPELVCRFRNESKAISLLHHPNIVKVYDISVSEHLQYIVMEYVDGMTLRDYLNARKGALTCQETVHFVSQILKALSHAHRNGVVHRDVKPQNIMLLDDGQLRMMDFGIARISLSENQLADGKTMGSVRYISPEQALGDETDAKSDLYSVGIMMYEMLSGKLPFDSEDAVEIARKQISSTPQPLTEIAPWVPRGLAEIAEKAMAKKTEQRYASAEEMLDALEHYSQSPTELFEQQLVQDEDKKAMMKKTNRTPSQMTDFETDKQKKKHSLFFPVLFGITAAFVVGCLILCGLILRNSNNPIFGAKSDITLENYIGKTREEVESSSQVASGQIRIDWVEEYSNQTEKGTIYKQSPAAGRNIREGQTITLNVSLGVHYVTVPDLANYAQADAERLLKEQGLSVLVVQSVEPSVDVGTVIRTDPAANEQVPSETTVVVYVSRQQVSTTTRVPRLIGLSKEDARTLLVQNHLSMGSVTEEYNNEYPEGTVLGQSVSAGETVKVNSHIGVTVSIGPEPEPESSEPEEWESEPETEGEGSASSGGDGGFFSWFGWGQ